MHRVSRFCAGVILALWPVFAQAETAQGQILVSGSGVVAVVPDMAVMGVGVIHRADTAQAAMDAVSQDLDSVIDRLKGFGVTGADVQTRNFYMRPIAADQGPREEVEITGYEAGNTLQVIVRDLEILGEVIGVMAALGANNLNGPRFDVQDRTPATKAARAAAVADAIDKAQQLAQAADVTLGPVQVLSEQQGGRGRVMMEAASSGFAVQSRSAPIEAGEINVTVSVDMTFAIAAPEAE